MTTTRAGGREASFSASVTSAAASLVHQHDGDVVLDAVHQLAGLADDLLPVSRNSSSPLHFGQARISLSSGGMAMDARYHEKRESSQSRA